jgi:hypothetical protein
MCGQEGTTLAEYRFQNRLNSKFLSCMYNTLFYFNFKKGVFRALPLYNKTVTKDGQFS